ncbi:hypothetical protein Scep_017154 [Stephania cephalantha]|uniref:Uncharacterized protein n=1 Tax=Stephania cephalantha TaxID=152367 RepID=A0AAP0IP15_9MAGN
MEGTSARYISPVSCRVYDKHENRSQYTLMKPAALGSVFWDEIWIPSIWQDRSL